jgi:hypothetical protein
MAGMVDNSKLGLYQAGDARTGPRVAIVAEVSRTLRQKALEQLALLGGQLRAAADSCRSLERFVAQHPLPAHPAAYGLTADVQPSSHFFLRNALMH